MHHHALLLEGLVAYKAFIIEALKYIEMGLKIFIYCLQTRVEIGRTVRT